MQQNPAIFVATLDNTCRHMCLDAHMRPPPCPCLAARDPTYTSYIGPHGCWPNQVDRGTSLSVYIQYPPDWRMRPAYGRMWAGSNWLVFKEFSGADSTMAQQLKHRNMRDTRNLRLLDDCF